MRLSCTTSVAGFALAALVLGTTPAYAQKTITQAKVNTGNFTPGDAPGFPLTISVRGAYKLTGNLTVPNANTTAIQITADNVTLDLNGFGIYGPGDNGAGHGVIANNSNVTVINGSVRGMGGAGLYLQGNTHRVENVYVTANGNAGIAFGSNSIIKGNTAILNNASRASAAAIEEFIGGGGSLVAGNVVNNNIGIGISARNGTSVIGNTVAGNSSLGLYLSNSVWGNNVMHYNNVEEGYIPQVNPLSGDNQISPNFCNTVPCR
jgi:hypothetical protein